MIENELLEAVASLVGDLDDYGPDGSTLSECLNHLREVYNHHYCGAKFARTGDAGTEITIVYRDAAREEINMFKNHAKVVSFRYGNMIRENQEAYFAAALRGSSAVYSVLVLEPDQEPGDFTNIEDAKSFAKTLTESNRNADCKVAVYEFSGSYEPRKHEWVSAK